LPTSFTIAAPWTDVQYASYDVTVMDMQMPEMDGFGALEAIRAREPDARIVMLTTYPGDARVVRALKAGACGYLLKSALR